MRRGEMESETSVRAVGCGGGVVVVRNEERRRVAWGVQWDHSRDRGGDPQDREEDCQASDAETGGGEGRADGHTGSRWPTYLGSTSSATRDLPYCSRDESDRLRLHRRVQFFHGVGRRPDGPFIELRAVVEAERPVACPKLVRRLEEAEDVLPFGVGRHPVPKSGREGRRGGQDELVEPPRDGTVGLRHLGDLREDGALIVHPVLSP